MTYLDDAPGGREATGAQPAEDMVWRGRPALRGVVGTWLITGGTVLALAYAVAWLQPHYLQLLARFDLGHLQTYGFLAWLGVGLGGLVLGRALWRTIEHRAMLYVLTSRRLIVHRGVFNRYHDQIELQRVRDLQTVSPFLKRLVGLGHVWVHSVDRSNPDLLIMDQPRAFALHSAIHETTKTEQERQGYREFESTATINA